METNRREVLKAISATPIAVAAGCFESTSDQTNGENNREELPFVDTPTQQIDSIDCSQGTEEEHKRRLVQQIPSNAEHRDASIVTSGTTLLNEYPDDGEVYGEFGAKVYFDGDTARQELADQSRVQYFIQNTDFTQQSILLVEDGWGSSSVSLEFPNITASEDGYHVVGGRVTPCMQTQDITVRQALLRLNDVGDEDELRVSITTDEDVRVNFQTDGEKFTVIESDLPQS